MDINLYCRECGEGDVLILLHGNGEEHSYFNSQIEYFSRKYKVIAIDTRGHGKSPRGDKPFTIEQFADDLKCFMGEHDIRKANILGFSDGANIAMIFALKYPENVEKLILNGGNLNPKGVKRSVQLPIEIGYKIASVFAKKSLKAKRNAEMLGLMVNEPRIEPETLKNINIPVLVIAGTKDMIKENHTRLIHKSIPKSKLVIIEGDHFVANKKPDEFNKAVEYFLTNEERAEKIKLRDSRINVSR